MPKPAPKPAPKLTFVHYANKWYRFLSIRFAAAAAALQAAYIAMPDEWKLAVPDYAINVVTLVFLALTALGALIEQPDITDPEF